MLVWTQAGQLLLAAFGLHAAEVTLFVQLSAREVALRRQHQ